MQTQVLVQPPFPALPNILSCLHLTDLSHFINPSSSPIPDKEPPSMALSDPSFSPTLPVLFKDDDAHHSGSNDHTPLSSPQQCSISASDQSRPTSHLPPSHTRTLSPSGSTSCPGTETQPSPCFSLSPSPLQIRPTPLFPPLYSAPHHQSHFASSATSYPPNMDRYPIANLADRYLRGTDKYPHNQHPPLDQRRMSEPAMYGNAASGHLTNAANLSNARHHQFQHQYSYVPPQSSGPHSSPLRRSSDTRPIGGSSWKEDHLPLPPYDSIELGEPLSPLNSTFSGGESPPPMGMSRAVFGSLHEDYGSSPPGTGTSTSSNAPATHQPDNTTGEPSLVSNRKQYSFITLPGDMFRKRPRRRYDEIERLYQCSWPDCTKSYGTLNHLNAHITMQKHGSKRSPNEFKEIRKEWRKAKKEEAEAKVLNAVRHGSHQSQHPSQHQTSPPSSSNAAYQTHNIYPHHPPRSGQPIGPLDDFHDPLAHQQDVYPRGSQRYGPFVSPHPQPSGIAYPHPHARASNTSNIPMNRLPTNSTLLTPLPGYVPSLTSGSPDFSAYDSYAPYRSDSHPRTGRGNPASHGDRGRLRSSQFNLGTGHNRDCP